MHGAAYKAKQPGQSVVEFAFIATILMLLLAGAIDLGRAFSTAVQLENMARAGAQYGTIAASLGDSNPRNGMIDAALNEQSSIFGITPTVTATGVGTGTGPTSDGSGYCIVTVTASYDFDPILPLPGIDTPISMSRSSTMRVQFVPAGSSCT